MHERNRT